MKHPLSFLTGFAAGLLAMYYFDDANGRRRRALARDRVRSAGQQAVHHARAEARLAMGRARGVVATRNLERMTRRLPGTDVQLHERIRARLGRLVSHPKAIHVDVNGGHVRLTGDVLHRELELVLREVSRTAGVHGLQHALQVHDSAQAFAPAPHQPQPAAATPSPGGTAFH